ncbi:hypothetical protein DPMN_037868 [Dreissena polymorpha]|uniref:Reverse transcriptase n=1 Tax=Dreissena polymorpha TaxID=45954 RepID=A0A9D4RPL6_DREPO|nr:hypothetical protein DPMN_037868 [Dreissena polymorpha]
MAYNCNKSTSGIKFGEIVHRYQKAITEQWGFYFERLYSPSISEHFDDKWRHHVSPNVGKLRETLIPDSNATVMPEDIERCIRSCPNGKAPGYDSITYEHLKPVASAILPLLANFFTAIVHS